MDGVITAIIGFIFVCIIFPSLIKNRHQYYAALFMVLVAFGFDNIARVAGTGRFQDFAAILGTFLVIGSVLLLILSAGGLKARDLYADVAKTIEVVRRGGEKETIIVPMTGEQPKPRDVEEPQRTRISLDD